MSFPAINQQQKALSVLVFCAAVSFFFAINLPPWYDEAITLLQLSNTVPANWPDGLLQVGDLRLAEAEMQSYSGIIQTLITGDVHPPLYYIVSLSFTKLTGLTVFNLRLVSIIATLMAFYLISKYNSHSKAALLLTPIVFFFPMMQWTAVNARGYGLAFLLVTMTLLFVYRYLDSFKGKYLYLASFCTGLAFLTHYFTIFVTGPLLMAAIIVAFSEKKLRLATLLIAVIICILLMVIAVPFLIQQLGARPDQYHIFTGFQLELTAVLRHIAELANFKSQFEWLDFFRNAICITLISTLMGYYLLNYKQISKQLFVTLFSFIMFFVMLVLLFKLTDKTLSTNATQRYMVFVYPCLFFMVLCFLERFGQLKTALFIYFSINTLFNWFFIESKPLPWRPEATYSLVNAPNPRKNNDSPCSIVPRGFGRGGPAVAMYSMENNGRILIIDKECDIQKHAKALATCSSVKIYKDEKKILLHPNMLALVDDILVKSTSVIKQ